MSWVSEWTQKYLNMHALYNGDVLIDFVEGNHAYYKIEDGKKRRLAGVTTLISVLDKPMLIPWAVRISLDYVKNNLEALKTNPDEVLAMAKEESNRQRDLAAEIGTAVHNWVEAHIKKENPDMPEDPKVLRGVLNFLDWVETHNVEFVAAEKIIYSKKYDYVGKLDILAKVDGKLCLVDIKTGNAIYSEARMQTEAYRRAHIEETNETVHGRWIWRISKESEEEWAVRQASKKTPSKDVYTPFESIYLDEDTEASQRDFEAFLACQTLYKWKKLSK